MKQSRVGKPELSTVIGTGTCEKIQMSRAGEVYILSNDVSPTPISREPGQDKPHMTVPVDNPKKQLHNS